MSTYICETGVNTRWYIRCEALRCGADLCVAVTGGQLPHVGALSLAYWDEKAECAQVQNFAAPTHRDDAVSQAWARRLCERLKCSAAVTAGIHVDNADCEDIRRLLENSDRCCEALLAALTAEA